MVVDLDRLQRALEASPVHRALRMRLGEDRGDLRLSAQVGAEGAPDGLGQVVHGGLAATLLDTAACFALVRVTGHDWITVDLRVDYLRPLATGTLELGTTVLAVGATLARARAWVRSPGAEVAAEAVGTFRRAKELGGGG